FFFSSRRRHTRWPRDWSSDVCSSDLACEPYLSYAADDKYGSHARVRLLHAEQLLDAISAATGVPEKFPSFPRGTPAAALPDGERSEERRVGKECRAGWWADDGKKNVD